MNVTIYKDERREWRWRLRSNNGNILADSGEGYATKRNAFRAFRNILRYMRGNRALVIRTVED